MVLLTVKRYGGDVAGDSGAVAAMRALRIVFYQTRGLEIRHALSSKVPEGIYYLPQVILTMIWEFHSPTLACS